MLCPETMLYAFDVRHKPRPSSLGLYNFTGLCGRAPKDADADLPPFLYEPALRTRAQRLRIISADFPWRIDIDTGITRCRLARCFISGWPRLPLPGGIAMSIH